MKTVQSRIQAALVIIALAFASFATVNSVAAENKAKPTISKKELKVLLKTAKEPVEHQKIAAYYRQEAARLNQSAKEHEELAELYAKNPPNAAMEAKHGTAFGQGAPHCHRWAELDAEQAKEAEALAALHEDMAKAAEQKQP
jgi:hypothetical protein